MPRIRIELPEIFNFQFSIPVRITDINYGGHVGNDAILSFLHEARVRFLHSKGFTELDLAGVSLIMRDVAIEYINEVFHGDVLTASVTAGEFSRAGFDMLYKLENQDGRLVAKAKTGMVCFDYDNRKVVTLPENAIEKLRS